jgi:anaerobic ribonucleoside-triphosphate reductase
MTKRELEKRIEELLVQKEHIEGEKCEVYSRVVGYLRPVEQWNDGKAREFKQRKTFKLQ